MSSTNHANASSKPRLADPFAIRHLLSRFGGNREPLSSGEMCAMKSKAIQSCFVLGSTSAVAQAICR